MDCPSCEGTGELENAQGTETIPCPQCEGTGEVDRHDGDGDPDAEAKYERDECDLVGGD